MTASFTIRDYRSEDEIQLIAVARDLQAHEAAIFDRSKQPEEIGSWYVARLLADVEKHDGRFLVADCHGEIVGYATLFIKVSSEDEPDEVLYTFSHVGDLAVLRSHRGLGIGRALIAECESLARAAGQKWLRLGVLADNHGARAFYRKVGLREQFLTLEKPLT